jgi:glycosyltransferase involved in cell wall biosynthesis
MQPLRVLLTCYELGLRSGSQLYTRDVAETLRELGHSPVVFSPRPGVVSEEMRLRGVAVIHDLALLGSPPDVIHGQHHREALEAMLRFPAVPALFVCHGWLPWQEAPPRFPSLLRYVAVDTLRRDRLVLEHGIPEEKVTILPNFVDLDRFRPRPPLPPKPRRALLFSNHGGPHTYAPAVEEACAQAGIELTLIGRAAGREEARPETILPSFDLVFARGRAALEAMATGAAVVLCDVEGAGPMVGSANFDALRALNFGLGALRPPIEPDRLLAEIRRYDPDDATKIRDRVRREAGRREAAESLVTLYRQVKEEGASLQGEEHLRACLDAAARYLAWVGPTFDRTQDELLSARETLQRTESELARNRATLEALENSPFSRLRARLLGWRPLVSAYRFLIQSDTAAPNASGSSKKG